MVNRFLQDVFNPRVICLLLGLLPLTGCSQTMFKLDPLRQRAMQQCMENVPQQIALPLWHKRNQQCIPLELNAAQMNRSLDGYQDNQCQVPYHSSLQDIKKWCQGLLKKHSPSIAPATSDWLVEPAVISNSSILPPATHFPLMTRQVFRQLPGKTPDSECQLTMDIYHPAPFAKVDQSSSQPAYASVLLLHGGSWRYRDKGWLMMQAHIAQLTEQGAVVFMPRYRLVGKPEQFANACDGVSAKQQLQDVQTAWQWASDHAPGFNADTQVALFGASAGGHLSLRLALDLPSRIKKVFVLYAPTDFERFARLEKQSGKLKGSKLLMKYLQLDHLLSQLQPQAPQLLDNAMAAQIGQRVHDKQTLPQIFAISGARDRLVPADQLLALCDAQKDQLHSSLYRNKQARKLAKTTPVQRCGSGGIVLIPHLGHGMDICLEKFGCDREQPARRLLAQSMASGFRWLTGQQMQPLTGLATDQGGDITSIP